MWWPTLPEDERLVEEHAQLRGVGSSYGRMLPLAWLLANGTPIAIGGSGDRATPRPPPPTIDGIPESPHDGLLFPHAFLGLLSMWVLTVAWTVQTGSGSGRVWTVNGPGAPESAIGGF